MDRTQQELAIDETFDSSIPVRRPKTQQRNFHLPKRTSQVSTHMDSEDFRRSSITGVDASKYTRSKTPMPNNYMMESYLNQSMSKFDYLQRTKEKINPFDETDRN